MLNFLSLRHRLRLEPQLVPRVLDFIAQRARHRTRGVNLHGYNSDVDAILSQLCPICPDLRTLSLQFCCRLTDTGLRTVADHCPRLQTLSLWDCHNIGETAFCDLLDKCRDLQILDLRGLAQLTDVAIFKVAELTSLTHVSLTGSGCTAASFREILRTRAGGLERLGCMCLQPSGMLGPHVLRGEHLVELQVGYSGEAFFVDLRGLPNLRFLGVSGNLKVDASWRDMGATKLEQLMADRCTFGADFLEGWPEVAGRMTYLCFLDPIQWTYDSLLPAATHMKSLRQIKLTNPSPAFLEALTQCPTLEFLWVERMAPTATRWTLLQGFPRLKYLYLGLLRGSQYDTASLIATLQSMPSLRWLYFEGMDLTDAVVGQVAALLPRLEVFDIASTAATAGCLHHLMPLKNLRQLYVTAPMADDEEFMQALVAELPLLQVLGTKLIYPEEQLFVASIFADWRAGKRRLPPTGYNEREAIKPPYSFVTACEFN